MVNIKKIIKIISWIIIALLGIALLLNWQTIESPVIIHADLSGNFSYGNKSTLIVFYLIIVLINLLFTFKYEIPLMKELHKMIKSSLVIDIISIFFQFLIIVVIVAFIVKAII